MKKVSNIIKLSFVLISSITFAQEKQNVLMIVLDDLNDFVGVMKGHPQAKTPNIDGLANEGVLFTNAHSNVPICSPSRASFMHGISPLTSKCWGFKNWQKNEILMNSKSLPEYAKENGYKAYQSGKVFHTAKKGAWDELGAIPEYGPLAYNGKKAALHPSNPEAMGELGPLDATFTSLADIPHIPATKDTPGYTGWYNTNWKVNKPFKYINDNDRDLMTDEQSVAWFRNKISKLDAEHSKVPFFMAVGFIRPHTPLVVPQKYFDMFPLEKVKIPVAKENDRNDTKLSENGFGKESRGRKAYRTLTSSYSSKEKAMQIYTRAYLASVAFADAMVGQTLKALKNSSFNDNTIVLLFSDHGYNMGEKDYLFKYSLWEESTRVPLIIKAPGFEKTAGKKVNHPVSLIDVFPTIQDLCEFTGKTTINNNGAKLDGHSLKPFLLNPKTKNWNGPEIALSVITSWTSKKPKEQHLAARSKNYRYIHYKNGAEELYDHSIDPYEWNNLADKKTYEKIKSKLKTKLFEQISKPVISIDSKTKKANEDWKNKYFKKHPEADINKDGNLTWQEYRKHRS
jgi:arylsulfatase A-like enzyme